MDELCSSLAVRDFIWQCACLPYSIINVRLTRNYQIESWIPYYVSHVEWLSTNKWCSSWKSNSLAHDDGLSELRTWRRRNGLKLKQGTKTPGKCILVNTVWYQLPRSCRNSSLKTTKWWNIWSSMCPWLKYCRLHWTFCSLLAFIYTIPQQIEWKHTENSTKGFYGLQKVLKRHS